MQSLASALGAQARAFTVDTSDAEEVERFLMDLPLTPTLEGRAAEYRARLDKLPEDSFLRPGVLDSLERTELLLHRAAQRDALQATRPEGCICLGLGGRFPRYTSTGERIYERPCTACPEGVAAQARRDELEREHRARQAIYEQERLFGAAKVPTRFQGCGLDTYPVSPQTQAAFDDVLRWTRGPGEDAPWADIESYRAWRKKSLFLFGPYGTGKTGLAVAVLRVEVPLEGGGLFFTVPTLLDAIRATYAPNAVADERQVIEAVKSAPFLVLDDLGAERVTDWVAEKLFTIINHRHDEDLPTVFTSNLDIPQLAQHIGERTAWRVVEMCNVVRVDGPNLRDQRRAA